MNPILPRHYYIPDVEARQWADGRIYLYGSFDIGGNPRYCSEQYQVFSSADLQTWTAHGLAFDSARAHPAHEHRLFAPDCICVDGRYALFYCGSDRSEGVAFSDTPAGPFDSAQPVAGADGDAIDPAALRDDDGKVYYFWGQNKLRGAQLNQTLNGFVPGTFNGELLNEARDGFHEGASIRKRNGIYYMVYADTSRGLASCLGYATSRNPLGPYTKQGIIIDNNGCDPQTWNNHGSIAEFNGHWYVFYHRSSQASKFSRRVCIEPIHFDAAGRIAEVEMTSQGAGPPLPANQPIAGYRACLFSGTIHTEVAPVTGTAASDEFLTEIHAGNWAAFKYVKLAKTDRYFEAEVAGPVEGASLEVHADQADGPLLGVCQLPATASWQHWQLARTELAQPVEGSRAIFLVFRGAARLPNLRSFAFRADY